MTDYYMNFPKESDFDAVKGAVPFEYSAEVGVLQSTGWSIDVLGGDNTRTTGWTAEGEPVFTPIEGFLVNLRSNFALPENLVKYRVFPESPVRVWA